MGLRWQLADVPRPVTYRTTSKSLFGYWQSAAERIEDPVWTEKTAVIEATIPAVTDLGFVNSPTSTDSFTGTLLTVSPISY